MTAPYWWEDPARGEPYHQGGTICFVHTGKRLLGVTAEHIHRKAVERSQDDWCQIGGHTFDPAARLIDADRDLDIATYDISDIIANAANADVQYALGWPPVIADNDLAIVGGWPWRLSTSRGQNVTHSFLHFLCRVQNPAGNQLGAALFTSTSVPWGSRPLPPGLNIGGMSGGPVYRVIENPLTQLALAGIVYEYQPAYELALARPLTLVRADGTIVRSHP